MRAVFLGAGSLTVSTARVLLKRGHEVVVIERDKDVIETLSEEIDCGFIHGDGSRPAILREADPQHTAVLYCLSNQDQTNIIASLVGRSLGFRRVVTKIDDPELEHICIELGLEDTIIPSRTIGIHLADLFEGRDPLEFSTMIRDEARVFSFVVRDEQAGPVDAIGLPKQTRVVCLYRDGDFLLPDGELRLEAEDEVVLITHRDNLEALAKQFKAAP
ncbi:MAG: TrkA family potassium uptake protein [Chromatiaceae bacterium]|nr:TrkA family potassium uptake protein [Chromatiaceae bacterium]MCP5313623.1 TrkA family potassium uptake protein [Chromatiaceae bacterium]